MGIGTDIFGQSFVRLHKPHISLWTLLKLTPAPLNLWAYIDAFFQEFNHFLDDGQY